MNASETGKLISSKRREKGLTQKELAEKLGVTDKAVSKWETGRGMPDVSVLENLSKELEVSVSEILNGGEVERELLPETADKIIVDTMKDSSRKVSRKRLMAIGAGVAASILMICILIFSYLFSQTVAPDDIKTLDKYINNYLSFRYSDERARVLEAKNEQDKLVVLYTHEGLNGLYIYNESRIFPGRYNKNLIMEIMPKKNGEINYFLFVDDGKTVMMVAGVELPKEARYYSVEFFGMEQIFKIENNEKFLDVYVYQGCDKLSLTRLLNKDKKPLYDDFGNKIEENWK